MPMKTKRTLAGAIASVALSGMLVAAQMQMPDKSSNRPGEASAMPKTLTGIVSDSMCGAHQGCALTVTVLPAIREGSLRAVAREHGPRDSALAINFADQCPCITVCAA